MGKTVIMAKNANTGFRQMFRTIEEAAEGLGISGASVSAASIDERNAKGWEIRRVERIFAVHAHAHNEWLLAVVNSKGVLTEFGNPGRRISRKEVDEIRDVTVGWYMQDGEE